VRAPLPSSRGGRDGRRRWGNNKRARGHPIHQRERATSQQPLRSHSTSSPPPVRPSVPVPPFAVAIIRRRRVARFERLKTSECKSAVLAADVASAAESSGTGAATASGREGGREGKSVGLVITVGPREGEREVGSFKDVNSTSYERGK